MDSENSVCSINLIKIWIYYKFSSNLFYIFIHTTKLQVPAYSLSRLIESHL